MKQYTAKNIEELLANVAKEKNVSVEELTYFIKEEKAGFLGFGSSVTAEVYALQDVVDFTHDYLEKFFEGFEIPVSISIEQSGNSINVNLDADNNAIIIGRGGKSLDGIRQMTRQAVSAHFKRRFLVTVDVNNYKNDRYAKLKAMAKRIARQVQKSKVDVSLDPMPNDERRVIHKELTDVKNIRTISEGEGRNRHLKIVYDSNKE